MFLLDHTYLSNMPHNIQYVKRAEYLKDSGDVDLSLDHHVIFFFFFFFGWYPTASVWNGKISLSSVAINHNAHSEIIVYGFNKEILF